MASGISIPITVDRKNYDKQTKQLVKDAKQLQKSLSIEYDSNKFNQSQRLVQEALVRTNNKAKSLKDEMTKLETAGKTDTEGYQKLQSQLIKTETDAVVLKKQLREIQQLKVDNLSKGFKDTGQAITTAGQALLTFSAAATGLIAGLAAIAKGSVIAGDEIGTTAQQLNISTKELQKWAYIAQQTDVDYSSLINGLTKVQVALGDLSLGKNNDQSRALEELGLTAEQAAKGMSENFENIILKLSNLTDSTKQAALANDLFGKRMGAQIIPLLNDGGEALNDMMLEFEKLGYLSDGTVKHLDNFEDVMDRIKYQLNLVKNTIGASFLPLMEAMANFVESKVVPALNKVADWFQTLDLNQQKFLVGTLTFIATLGPVLLIIGKMTTGIGSMIPKIVGLKTAMTGLSASMGVFALIAGVFALLYSTNEDFRESINNLIGTILSSLKPVLNTLMDTLGILFEAISPILTLLANLLVPIINVLTASLKPVLSLISNLANIVLTMLGTKLQFAAKILSGLVDLISQFLLPVLNVLSETFTIVYEGIAEGFDKAFDWVYKGLEKAVHFINQIIGKLNSFGDAMGIDALSNLKDIEINVKAKSSGSVSASQEASKAANKAITQSTVTQVSETSTIDNSTQNITIEQGAFQVNNYAEGLDAEQLAEDFYKQINLRLRRNMN